MAIEYRLSYTAQEIDERLGKIDGLENKQDKLTFDSIPTEGSENLVKSGDIYTAIQNATPNLTFDEAPTEGSENLVKSGAIHAALQNVGGTDLVAGDFIEIKDGVVRCTLGDLKSGEIKEEIDEVFGLDSIPEMEIVSPDGYPSVYAYGTDSIDKFPKLNEKLIIEFTKPNGEKKTFEVNVEGEADESYGEMWAYCNCEEIEVGKELVLTKIDENLDAIYLFICYSNDEEDPFTDFSIQTFEDFTGTSLFVGYKTVTDTKEYVLLPDTALGLGREIVTEVNEEIFSAENIVEEDYGNGRYCLEYDLSSNPSNKFPSPNGKLTIEFDLSDGTKKTFVVDVEHRDEGSEQIYEAYYNCAYVGADGKEELMKTDENSDALYFNFYHYSSDEPETCLTIETWADYSGASITIKNSTVKKTRVTLPNEALNFDSKPTEGSTNLVNSGDLYNFIGDIKTVVSQINALVGGAS